MYPDKKSKSARLYTEACNYLPGGNTRRQVYMSPYQLYAERGEGFNITDVDGVVRVDFSNNATSLVHGHAHPEIVAAVKTQLELGTAFTIATESEIRLAKLLCDRIPSVERVRFTNSGTEGVMMAIKAARAFTKRPKIAKCEGAYHGSYDFAEVSLAPTPEFWGADDAPKTVAYGPGTPDGVLNNVLVLPYNNPEAAERLIEAHKHELACIVVDLMPGHLNFVEISPAFLSTLRRVTQAHGIVLIYDEVISLRLGYHGNQREVGVLPDLTAMGKIIGGGFPVGAVGGRADIMGVFDPRGGKPVISHAGTFNANPITMTAGRKAMELYTEEEVQRINRLGDELRTGLRAVLKEESVPGRISGKGSLFKLAFYPQEVSDYRGVYRASAGTGSFMPLFQYLLNHGIMMGNEGRGAISTPMTQSEIGRLTEAVRGGVRELKKELMAA